jgi:hypothetical protein
MKPAKKKERPKEINSNDEFIKKPVKKTQAKRDRKLSIYDPLDEEDENADLDLFDYDVDDNEEDDF